MAARHDDIGEHKLAEDDTKSHSGKVKDVMTPHVVSVTETASIANIAFLLETNRIKRVPAVRDGKLGGVVSRGSRCSPPNHRSPSVSVTVPALHRVDAIGKRATGQRF